MLSDEVRARVTYHVKSCTLQFRTAKDSGYNLQAFALPTFDSQEDFDICRPEDKGKDFREHNEFTAEVLKGLIQNGVPAEPVVLHGAAFIAWLDGRSISQDSRAGYAAYLLSDPGRKKAQ